MSSQASAPAKRVILITGASAGIGRSTSIALSKVFPSALHPEPLVLVLVGRRQAELEVTAKALRDGTEVEIAVGDVGVDADVERIFGSVREKYGRLDVLFNNAGVDLLPGVLLEDSDMDKFRSTLNTNIMAAVLCTQQAFRLMGSQEPKGGRIINNGSISSSCPRPNSFPYTISKHAISGLTKCTSLDGRKHKIVCTQIDIGNAATDMANYASKGSRQADGSMKPEPVMSVENVANTIVYLAGLPLEADVPKLEILAAGMPYVGRG